MLRDVIYSFKVCKHVKSNSIVLAKNKQTVGIGAGQMSRVDATKLSLMKHWVFLAFLISVSVGQIVYHQPVHTAPAKSDLPIEAIIDDNGYGLDQVYIFFRTINYNFRYDP